MNKQEDIEKAKRAAGRKAAELVKSGMSIGLGTGSTVFYFLEALAERKTRIAGLPSSLKTIEIAKKFGIPLIEETKSLDLTVDGADEIDPKNQMIKGGGGALLREKICAAMSKNVIIVIDSSKRVEKLGKFPLPIEISSFSFPATLNHLTVKGFQPVLRKGKTDNGNLIVDLQNLYPIENPELLDQELKKIVGVLDTGLFFDLARSVIVGYPDGKTETV